MDFDLIIIGGGAAGLGAARAARAVDAKPVLISDGPIGGDCTFTGCIPSKTLIAASRAGTPFPEAMTRVRQTVEQIAATESIDVLRREGIEVIEGRAMIQTPDAVNVDGSLIRSEHIIVATGARPVVPGINGLHSTPYLTNESLFDLDQLPRRLSIVGAGAIGSEMAMAFAGFGTEVTLIESAERILPVEEPEASEVIAAAMNAAGISVLTNTAVETTRQNGLDIEIVVEGSVVDADAILVAAGRHANSSGFGLEELGVELDVSGHIVVDEKLRSNVKGISAAGDVTGLLPFTHAADEQGRMAVAHALGKGARWKYDSTHTPWVTFTDPEVARLGVTEAEAAGLGGRVAYLPLDLVDRAITEQRTDGFVKLIAGPKTFTRGLFGGKLIGATIVAPRAGEMIHGPTIAARLGMFVGRLAQVTTPYPTWSTAVQQAAAQFFQEINGLKAQPAKR